MAVAFAILGPLEVRDGERRIEVAGAKRRQVLATLLLHANEVVSGDALIDALWGEDPPATAPKALQMHVVELRRLLGTEAIVTRPTGYILQADPSQLDLTRFERAIEHARTAASPRERLRRLDAALALWRGPPLADVEVSDRLRGDVARLAELWLRAAEDRIDARLATGEHAGVVAELEPLVAQHPLRERLRAQLMLALYRTGRQADALAVFRDTRRLLVDELGLEPGRELRELEARILEQDRSLDVAVPAAPRADGLVGRERELELLLPLVDDALAGRGAVALLAGEAGIGKSRLAEALARHADTRGAMVLVGRCWEAGGAPPYWPWVQILRDCLRTVGADALPAAARADLAVLVPELRAGAAAPDDADRFRLFAAFAEVLRHVARAQPVALFLDDVHGADPSSALLLRYLAEEVRNAPLLIVAAYRHDEVDDALAGTLNDLARAKGVRRVNLRPLEREATGHLLALTTGRDPDPSLVARIHARTEGNALFGVELGHLLAASGQDEDLPIPAGVTATIERRLEQRSDRCREVLTMAAVLGREFAVDALAAATGLAEDPLLDVLEEAESARLVGGVPGTSGRLRFAHMMVRDALYEGLPAVRRLRLHRQVGEALEVLYARDLAPHVAELAHHFLRGGSGVAAKALEYAVAAGDHAAGQQAHEDAAQQYGEALDLLQAAAGADAGRVCELLLARGEALSRAGDEQAAKVMLREAAERAGRAARPDVLARAAVAYGGRFAWARASTDPALGPLLERALEAIGDGPSAPRVELLARLTAAYRDEPRMQRSAAYAEEALALARALDDPRTLVSALQACYFIAEAPDRAAEALTIAAEIVTLSERLGDQELAYQGHDFLLTTRWKLADRAGVEMEIEHLRRLAAVLRQPAHRWHVGTADALLALMEGRLRDAERIIDETYALGRIAASWNADVSHRLSLFVLRRHQGRLAELEDAIARSARELPALLRFSCALAHLYAEAGRLEEARALVDEITSRDLAHEHVDAEWLFALAVLADPCAAVGGEGASRLYDVLRPYDRLYAHAPSEAPFGAVARALGVLAHAGGRLDAAVGHFERAIEIERRMRARPWLAHAQHGLADALRARAGPGDRDRAAALRADARDAYAALGMDVWAQRAARPG